MSSCLAQKTRLEKMNLTNLPHLSSLPLCKLGTPKSKAIKIIMQIIHIFHLKKVPLEHPINLSNPSVCVAKFLLLDEESETQGD